MTPLRYVGDPYVRYEETIPPTPEPLPVGASRTHTINFEREAELEREADQKRRRLTIYALVEAADAALITVMIIGGAPALIHDYLYMPTFAGLPLALVLAVVWLVIAWRVVNDIWPKDG